MIDSRAQVNVLRYDIWQEIAGASEEGFGASVVQPLSKVPLATQLDGASYQLCYVVVPTSALKEEVIIGDPLRDYARVILGLDKPVVEPRLEAAYVHQIVLEQSDMQQALEGVREEYREGVETFIRAYKPEAKSEKRDTHLPESAEDGT